MLDCKACLLSEIGWIDFFSVASLISRHPATWLLFGDSSWDSSRKKHERLLFIRRRALCRCPSFQQEELRWSLLVGFPGDFELLGTVLCRSVADDMSETGACCDEVLVVR